MKSLANPTMAISNSSGFEYSSNTKRKLQPEVSPQNLQKSESDSPAASARQNSENCPGIVSGDPFILRTNGNCPRSQDESFLETLSWKLVFDSINLYLLLVIAVPLFAALHPLKKSWRSINKLSAETGFSLPGRAREWEYKNTILYNSSSSSSPSTTAPAFSMSTPKNINFKPPADPLPESFQARPSHSEIDSDSENSLEHLGPCIRPGSPPVETNKAIMAAFKAITNHFPLPGSPGAPYFTGANITDFLEQYEETCYDFGIGYDEMINRLPRYCDQTSKDIVKSLPEWKLRESWELLVKALKAEFREFDRQQIRDTLAFLKEFVLVTRTPKELKNYCRTFTRVSNTLINQKILSEVERGRLFLLGLPTGLRNKIIKHFKVDERDPVTYAQFEDFSTFALKADLSERTIEAMEKEKEPTSSFTKDLKSLVQEHSKALEVTEEAKRNPVVIPFTRGPGPGVKSASKIKELEAQFSELRIQRLETSIEGLLQETHRAPQFGNRQAPEGKNQHANPEYPNPASLGLNKRVATPERLDKRPYRRNS
ncbi:unnamed protein product [Diplocarpon coronariae]